MLKFPTLGRFSEGWGPIVAEIAVVIWPLAV
jgi:hypothetical protein